jgi:hypothetical protein
MNENPYAPPKSVVADVVPRRPTAEPVFFPVSKTKLVVMSVLTLGFYDLVWFYQNWWIVRLRTGQSLSPVLRTIFAVLFCYGLFDRVRKAQGDDAGPRLQAGPLAVGWILTSLAGNFVGVDGSSPVVGLLGIAIGLSSVLFLVRVQDAVNAINRREAPDHDPNERFTGLNWFWLVLGGLLTLLTIVGTLMPE